MTHHAQSRFIDVLKIVIQGVPHVGEATIAAVRLQVDDIDGRDAGDLVHRDVVVANHRAEFAAEIGTIAKVEGATPHLVAHPSRTFKQHQIK